MAICIINVMSVIFCKYYTHKKKLYNTNFLILDTLLAKRFPFGNAPITSKVDCASRYRAK